MSPHTTSPWPQDKNGSHPQHDHKWVSKIPNGRFIVGFITLLIITVWKSPNEMDAQWLFNGNIIKQIRIFYTFFKRSCCHIATQIVIDCGWECLGQQNAPLFFFKES